MRELIGADNDYVADQVLRAGRDLADVVRDAEWTKSPALIAAPDSNAKGALEQAASIVRDAADAVVEIDWSRDPADDLERDARLAIIQQIEVEATEQEARYSHIQNGRSHLACSTLLCLRRLQPIGTRNTGSDLHEAIEGWGARFREEQMQGREIERRRLLKAARQRIDNAPPEAA